MSIEFDNVFYGNYTVRERLPLPPAYGSVLSFRHLASDDDFGVYSSADDHSDCHCLCVANDCVSACQSPCRENGDSDHVQDWRSRRAFFEHLRLYACGRGVHLQQLHRYSLACCFHRKLL